MTSRWPPTGFVSDSSREGPMSPKKKILENILMGPKSGFLSKDDDITMGPRAMKVSQTGEKEIVPLDSFDSLLSNSTNPFYSIKCKEPRIVEDLSIYPKISSKQKLKKNRPLKKRSTFTTRRNHLIAQYPFAKKKGISSSTQTDDKMQNYDHFVRRKFEKIGDASKFPSNRLSTSPREIKSIVSVVTLLLLLYWVLSIFFEVTLSDIIENILEYVKHTINLRRKKLQPKTKVEILVQYLKKLFGY